LNKPLSPTEYFHDRFLRKLIRDPAAVRHWGQQMMPAFAKDVISDSKLDDLLTNFRLLAKEQKK